MERVALGDISLSRLVYGMSRLGDDSDTSASHVQAKVEACLAQGITSFDQANIYGGTRTEALLGEALRKAPHLRNKMEIITKCNIVAAAEQNSAARVKQYDSSAAHIMASVHASLQDMAVDHIDLLLLHRPDPLMDPQETGAALDKLVTSGKVRAVGVSNFRPWDFKLLQAAMENPLATNQIELNLIKNEALTNGDLAFLQERGIAPMAWSPLAGGRLLAEVTGPLRNRLIEIGAAHGTDWGAAAVAWLLRHPARIIPVLGTNSLPRIGTIRTALDVEIDRETWFELYTLILGHEVA